MLSLMFMTPMMLFPGEYSIDDAWSFEELEEHITKGYL